MRVDWIDPAEATDAAGADLLLGRPGRAWRHEGRIALGLPVDRPLMVSGHQAGPWHPGILAKYAVLRAAQRWGAEVRDLLVEHDTGHPLAAAVPVRGPAGRLVTRRLEWATVPEDRALIRLAPARIRRPDTSDLAVDAAGRLAGWAAALDAARAGATHVAGQVRAALAVVLPAAVAPPGEWTGSVALLATPLGRALVTEMTRDPWTCAAAYARAVRGEPGLGLPPLHVRDDFVELPLWRITPEGRRRRADDTDAAAWLEGGPGAPVLAPRALLLTAIARLGLADVFVHGLGGAAYDRAMREWIRHWLGVRPAPAMVASADLRLELGVGRATRAAAARRDRLLIEAHRTWHDPEPPERRRAFRGAAFGPEATTAEATPGRRSPGPVKRELLAAIDAAPRGSAARRRAWRRMHTQLEALRGVHVGRVEAAQRRSAEADRAVRSLAIAERRDWFAVLHPPGMLEDLASRVAGAPAAAELEAVVRAWSSGDRSGGPSRPTGGGAPTTRSARCGSPPA